MLQHPIYAAIIRLYGLKIKEVREFCHVYLVIFKTGQHARPRFVSKKKILEMIDDVEEVEYQQPKELSYMIFKPRMGHKYNLISNDDKGLGILLQLKINYKDKENFKLWCQDFSVKRKWNNSTKLWELRTTVDELVHILAFSSNNSFINELYYEPTISTGQVKWLAARANAIAQYFVVDVIA